ncbi:hypothetical protein [Mesorhizobium sp. M0243]|uniref:hypothetical protein n=1 Tax=unclassified Mesorhizobium TaxID=325217 RepID=UPI003335347C
MAMWDFPVPGFPTSSTFSPAAKKASMWNWKQGLARQFGIEGPVKLGERQFLIEPGLLISPLDKAGLATVQFVLQDQGESLQEGLVCALRLQHARLQRVADARQAQLSKAAFNFWYGHHGLGSPV